MAIVNFPKGQKFLIVRQSLTANTPSIPRYSRWHKSCFAAGEDLSIKAHVKMKIEKASQRGMTTVRMSGHFQAEHIEELSKQLQDNGPRLVLDMKEVTVVDVEVVRFLGTREAKGITIVDCPRYIREWINREGEA